MTKLFQIGIHQMKNRNSSSRHSSVFKQQILVLQPQSPVTIVNSGYYITDKAQTKTCVSASDRTLVRTEECPKTVSQNYGARSMSSEPRIVAASWTICRTGGGQHASAVVDFPRSVNKGYRFLWVTQRLLVFFAAPGRATTSSDSAIQFRDVIRKPQHRAPAWRHQLSPRRLPA